MNKNDCEFGGYVWVEGKINMLENWLKYKELNKTMEWLSEDRISYSSLWTNEQGFLVNMCRSSMKTMVFKQISKT